MAVRFYLDNRPDKNGDHPIRVSISLEGNRFLTTTGFNIPPEKWTGDEPKKKSEEPQRVKQGCYNSKGVTYSTINARLKEIDAFFAGYESDLSQNRISDIDIKQLYADNFGKRKNINEVEKNLFYYLDEFTKEMGVKNSWTTAVFNKFNALKNHLLQYDKNLTFDDLTESGLTKLVDYFQKDVVVAGTKTKEYDTRVYGMRNTTIKKQLGFIKWFLRWAKEKGYTTETAFASFKPKLKTNETKVIFLDWKELMTIYNFEVPESKKYLDRVRDVFCFCCFTSLRYSDVANLKRSDIFKNHISVTTIKTSDSLTIDLNDYSRAILEKYKKEKYPDNLALPVISNQRMNEYLKELCQLCGFDESITITYFKGNQRYDEVYPKYALIGTHTARRTFISNALMMGIPVNVVMQFTGHSDYKAMKPYIAIADRAKSEAMKMFNMK